ncbi:hypothetical protein EMCRGX_G007397 [Ephydatia muelleri]
MSSARTPVRPLGTGEDSERRVSSPFLSSSRSLLQPADSRRQESAAGSTGNVNVQILAAIKSLQEQVADLQAKSTQPAASSIEQCAVSKKAPKELLTSIHSVVRHLRERLDAPMQWDTSSGFSSPENMRVTSEIVTACVNEKYPASVVQKATKKYFTTLKRRSRLQTNNKLPDARKKQRRLQRKHHKLQNRKVALSGSTTLTQEQKEKFSSILRIEYMSSEESAEESDYLWKIAPPPIFSHNHCPPVASQNSSSVLSQLKCQLCSNLLTQPLELPPASNLILLLLADILVHCVSCSRDVKADASKAHKCTPSNEEREAVVLLKKAISTSTEKGIIHLANGGTPMTFIQVTKARNPTTAVSLRTVKMRCSEMQTMRSIVSGGEPSALIQNEVLVLNDEEIRALLQKAGISSTIAIGAAEVLAIKAGLVIPWNKLRLLRRTRRLTWHEGFIPASEVCIKIGGDKGGGTFKMNFQIVNIATPNSVHNTCVFCCFAAGDSVTNLHAALDRFKDQIEHLNGMKWGQYTIKIFICGDFEFLSKMYGLSGASGCYPCPYCIIHSEMMATPLSVRGHAAQRTLETMRADHQRYVSAGSIKRDAQKFYNCISPPIFDIPVSQVCPPGYHITLGIFTKMFNLLEAVCCNLDLELALHATDVDSSSFSKYSLELQKLPLLQAELEEAQQALENFQQMATYVVLVGGAERPLCLHKLQTTTCQGLCS